MCDLSQFSETGQAYEKIRTYVRALNNYFICNLHERIF